MALIAELFREKKVSIMLKEQERMYVNVVTDRLCSTQKDISSAVPPLGEYDGAPIYQAVFYIPEEEEGMLQSLRPLCEFTRWHRDGIDLFEIGGGKVPGIREYLHRRGIAREDEANFIAFLVCISSDDAYIRYSGYLNLYEYVASSLYRADPDLYFEARDQLPMTVRYEMSAYSKFFDKYRDSVAGEISGTVNDLYLKGNGTEGTRSYGLVVDLAVAYDKKINP